MKHALIISAEETPTGCYLCCVIITYFCRYELAIFIHINNFFNTFIVNFFSAVHAWRTICKIIISIKSYYV